MQISTLATQVQELGLTEKQAKVYVANLFLGAATAQKIAEQAEVNRPTTYDILDELAKVGLVSKSHEGAKTLFVAASPSVLQEMMKRQAEELRRREDSLNSLLPKLQEIERDTTAKAGSQPVVRFVRGKEGVDAIWAYVVRKAKPGGELLGMTNHDETLRVYPDHLETNAKIRLGKKLKSKQFYHNSKREVSSDPALLKETIRLTEPIPADVTLYEDMAVLLSYGNKNDKTWTGIIIESKDIVAVLRQLFKMAWDNRCK